MVQRTPQIGGANGEQDVRGTMQSGPIPQSETDSTRLAVRRTMKQLSGPYSPFDKYYPLEDTIELYNEIWYESSSSDDWVVPWTHFIKTPQKLGNDRINLITSSASWLRVGGVRGKRRMDLRTDTDRTQIDAVFVVPTETWRLLEKLVTHTLSVWLGMTPTERSPPTQPRCLMSLTYLSRFSLLSFYSARCDFSRLAPELICSVLCLNFLD